MAKFNDILDAFTFVSSEMYGMNYVMFCPKAGKFFYRSDRLGLDEENNDEEDIDHAGCIGIPHKNDLDLGQRLVFEFIETNLPEKMEYVERIFRKRGAYSKLKELLDSKGRLQAWYDFENSREEEALRQWCADNGIKLDD